jgi:centrin-3
LKKLKDYIDPGETGRLAAFASLNRRSTAAAAAAAPAAMHRQSAVMDIPRSALFMHQPSHQRSRLRSLSDDMEGEVAYAFDRLSEGQDGEVTPRQLKIALRAMGFPVKKADVRSLLRDAGLDAALPLCFDSFREVCAAKLLERSPREEVARAFQLFDLGGGGGVSAADLRVIAKQLQASIAE